MGQGIQQSTTAAGSAFNRFVEGDENPQRSRAQPEKKDFWDSFGEAPKGPAADKKDFWDEFASAGDTRTQTQLPKSKPKPSGIGTSAMKKSSGGGPGGAGGKEDEWGEW